MQQETPTSSLLLLLFLFVFKFPFIWDLSEKHFIPISLLVKASLDDIFERGNFSVPILLVRILAFSIRLL